MSSESLTALAGDRDVLECLDEHRTAREDLERFLDGLLGDLAHAFERFEERHAQWQEERREAEEDLRRRSAQLDSHRRELAEWREQLSEDLGRLAATPATTPPSVEGGHVEHLLAALAEQKDAFEAQRRAVEDLSEHAGRRIEAAAADLCGAGSDVKTACGSLLDRSEHLERQLEQLLQSQTQDEAVPAASPGEFLGVIGDVQTAVQQQREAVAALAESTSTQWSQLAPALAELTGAHGALAEIRVEICDRLERIERGSSEGASPGAAVEEWWSRLRQAEEERSHWEGERQSLETELETLRQRAADLAESLESQKRLLAQQQSEWSEELRRQRRLLEGVAERIAQQPEVEFPAHGSTAPAAVTADPAQEAGAGSGDAVLDSVMVQFEMLQKDLARRRKRPSGAARAPQDQPPNA